MLKNFPLLLKTGKKKKKKTYIAVSTPNHISHPRMFLPPASRHQFC